MKIGSRTVIGREYILLSEGERAEFSITHKEVTLNFLVEFTANFAPSAGGATSSVSWSIISQGTLISFSTMNNMPFVTRKPLELGKFEDGSKLLLLAESTRSGPMGIIALQFMAEEMAHG